MMDQLLVCWANNMSSILFISSYMFFAILFGFRIEITLNKFRLIMDGVVWSGLCKCCLLKFWREISTSNRVNRESLRLSSTLVKICKAFFHLLRYVKEEIFRKDGQVLLKYFRFSKVFSKRANNLLILP